MKQHVITPRRIAGPILLSIALGLITTIAVAWIVAYVGDAQGERVRSVAHWPNDKDDDGIALAMWIPGKCGDFYLVNVSYAQGEYDDRDRAPEFVLPAWVKRAAAPVPHIKTAPANSAGWCIIHAYGWPYRSLWCKFVCNSGAKVPAPSGGIELSRVTNRSHAYQWGEPASFPLRPAWFGLFLDVGLYAAGWLPIVFTLRFVVWQLRTHVRVGRGQCPRCGYDVKDQPIPGCPECGWNRVASPQPPPAGGGRGS